MKQTISFLLVMIFLFLIFPVQSLGADVVETGVCGDSVKWRLYNDGKLYIFGNGRMSDYSDPRAYSSGIRPWKNVDVTNVVIDDGVTSIGAYAFADLYYLTHIDLPDSVAEIGKNAFQYCSLFSIKLPKNLKTISECLFALCNLRSIYIPKSVNKIERGALYETDLIEVNYEGTKSEFDKITVESYNEDLETAQINYNGGNKLNGVQYGSCGDNVNYTLTTDGILTISGTGLMDSYCGRSRGIGVVKEYYTTPAGSDHPWFNYRSLVKKIVIKSGVKEIGDWAFFDCFNCKEVVIESGLKSIGKGAFLQTPLASVDLPDTIEEIGSFSFCKCYALTDIKLPIGLKTISSEMLMYCNNLKELHLPSGLEKIEHNALYFCNIDSLTLPDSLIYIGSHFGNNKAKFLGGLPNMDSNDVFAESYLDYSLSPLKTCICEPQYYNEYKAFFTKWGIEASLSTKDINLVFEKNTVTLDPSKQSEKLSYRFEEGSSSGLTATWWVDDNSVASIDQNGIVHASGHGSTLAHVELTDGINHYMASATVTSKRNDLMIKQLPTILKPDFPVTCGTTISRNNKIVGYQAGKLAERDLNNPYYKELKQFTEELIRYASSDTEKAKAIFDWVIKNVKYAGGIGIGNYADQAYAVFLNRKAHCEGFAKLTGFMLYLAGIPSCLVASYGHMWNAALIDGKWTMIDSTNSRFAGDYNDYGAIKWMGFGEDEFCFVVDSTDGVKLVGTGDHVMQEDREDFVSVIVPDYVKQVTRCAFDHCSNLKTVVLPESVVFVQDDVFDDVDLNRIYYKGTEMQWNNAYSGSFSSVVFDSDPIVSRTVIPPAIELSCSEYIYNGSVQRPDVSIRDSKGNTVSKSNYTVSYSDSTSKAVGEYTVTVEFQNDYCGCKTLSYKIIPSQVTGLKASSIKAKSIELRWTNCSDSSSYKVEMSKDGEKTWETMDTVSTNSCNVSNLQSGTDYKFRVTALDETKMISGKASAVLDTRTLDESPEKVVHKWDSGNVTKAATCTTTGVKTYICTVCRVTRTETIAKNASNHSGGTEIRNVRESTCAMTGYTGDTYCKGCGAKLSRGSTTAATGKHTWNSGNVTKAATCIATGIKTYTCTVCKTTKTETIAKSSHKEQVIPAVAATCTKTGLTAGKKCSVCGTILNAQSATKALGHVYKTTVISPTCTAEGFTIYTCLRCNYCFMGNTKGAKGHNYDSGKVTKEPTYKVNGERTYICTVCGATKKVEITKLKAPIVAKVSGLKASKVKTNAITLKWSEAKNADQYKVYRSTDGKKWTKITTTYKLSYTDKDVKSGIKYQYKVKGSHTASGKNGEFSAVLKTGTLTAAPKISSLKSTKAKTATVIWKKVTGAKSYIVYTSKDNKKWTKAATTTNTTATLSKLAAGRKMYVKVVAVNAYGKTGAFSSVRAVKVKK